MREFNKKIDIEDSLSLDNIADEMDGEDLEWLGSTVYENYMEDKRSRKDWEDKLDEWMSLAMQVTQEKTFPWVGASNVKYPLLTTAALQFAARAYPALVPGTNVVKGRVTGGDPQGQKADRARRVGKHMSYQLLEQMDDWEEEMDKLCISLPILGTMFKKTYYAASKQRNVSELIYPKDLVINYWAKDIESAQRKTQVLYFSKNDIYERQALEIFSDIPLDELTPESDSRDETSDEIHGVAPPRSQDPANPYCFLECHMYMDLDQDGYEEPYIVTIDSESKKVFRIVARYDENSISRTLKGDILRIEPEEYFTKFGFVPNPDGSFYDVGFGLLLGPINESVNTLINQLTDAGTLANLQGGFISKGIRIKSGDKSFTPGEWKPCQSTGDDLRKGIFPLPTRDPSNVLFTLLSLMIESGQKLASVTDMLLGENPGQNQPATTSMAVLEQGLKVFTSIYKRLYRSLKKEYEKLYILNGRYLDEREYFTILDPGEEQGEQIFKIDYNVEDMDVKPASDPNVATETKRLMKAAALQELIGLGTINPVVFTKRMLEAQDQEGIEELMTMPPPPGPPPEVVLEQEKFQDESNRDWARINNERTNQENNTLKTETTALLNIAKAEQAEIGQQLEIYKTQLEAIKQSVKQYNTTTGEIE